MSLLTKLIYASDAIEESRNYPNVDKLREEVFKDFEYGIYLLIKHTIQHLEEINKPIEQNTFDAYLEYKEVFNEI